MDIELALHDLLAVEQRLESLYAWFAAEFADDEAAVALWGQMSREERSHAELVQAQIKLVAAAPEQVLGDDHPASWREVQELLTRTDRLRNAPLPPSLEDALQAAILFESSGAELYSVRSLVHARPEIQQLLRRLSEANRHHHQRLLEFATKRGALTFR